LFADLEATRRSFPRAVRDDPARETFTLAVSIVSHFFGHKWYLDDVFQDAARSRPDGFMRIDYTPGAVGESKTSRVLDFAENLFNSRISTASTLMRHKPARVVPLSHVCAMEEPDGVGMVG
jgi:hypothetical protein